MVQKIELEGENIAWGFCLIESSVLKMTELGLTVVACFTHNHMQVGKIACWAEGTMEGSQTWVRRQV